jgi:hypothetical protein
LTLKKLIRVASIYAILLICISCNNAQHANSNSGRGSFKTTVDGHENLDINENSFFKTNDGKYHYKNVRFYNGNLIFSPYVPDNILVKEIKEVKGDSRSEGQETTITLDLYPDNDIEKHRTFKRNCDEVRLYPYFIECITNEPGGGWDRIELFKYDDFAKPFLKSDEQYWLFNMTSDNQHIAKNVFFITIDKFLDSLVCRLRLSDMNGTLQVINVKVSDKMHEIDFIYPQIKFSSENPFEYPYHANQSEDCSTISISPRDHNDLRKHITRSSFKLVFYDKNEQADSFIVPVENGMFYDKPDTAFNVVVFK